ncbi:MAG: hypothetical protein IKX70_05790 [Treponema sp.]|nr:hypothetical protein [Treponema sp.]
MKLLKNLMTALSVLIAIGMLVACTPGSGGNTGSNGTSNSNGNESSSSSGTTQRRTIKSSTDNEWDSFNFELFNETGLSNYNSDKFTLSSGNWKYSQIVHNNSDRKIFYTYKEFYSQGLENVNASWGMGYVTKCVIVIKKTLTDEEIDEMETMSDDDFNNQYVPDSTDTESCDYYLSDHVFVTIQAYSGKNNIPQLERGNIETYNLNGAKAKVNADSTKFLSKFGTMNIEYFEKKQL